MKIDTSKVYDMLEWQFLRAMMLQMGFQTTWVDLIMQRVCSLRYKILHNGTEIGQIFPKKWLRQGDPPSPIYLLFVLKVYPPLSWTCRLGGSFTGVA